MKIVFLNGYKMTEGSDNDYTMEDDLVAFRIHTREKDVVTIVDTVKETDETLTLLGVNRWGNQKKES